MLFRFAGFELDQQRAELRGPGGEAIKLRQKTLDMLALFAANAGRVLAKQELMEAFWPNVHVGEGSLFQCINELRTALGDENHQIIKLVYGRGYLFDAEVSMEPLSAVPASPAAADIALAAAPAKTWRPFDRRGPGALAAVAALAVIGLAIAAPIFWLDIFTRRPPSVAVMPIAGDGAAVADTAAAVTTRLADGLAKINNLRVVTPDAASTSATAASAHPTQADFVLTGELQKTDRSWELRARLTRTADREVIWTAPVSVAIGGTDSSLQQSRLAAGLGHPLALRINELVHADAQAASDDTAKVVVEQATAQINQVSKERFAAAQTILEKALADEPNNVDVAVALAALQLRGIQMDWYGPADAAAVEERSKSMLERALRAKPDTIPVLEAYCRFLTATNHFTESLVACARALRHDPWNGLVMFNLGVTQIELGRFEDALATFTQADRFDTPQVSRWTWLLGAGWANLLLGRNEDAVPWLQRSIAITPGTGRTHLLLAAAYQQLGRTAEAKAAVAKALELRPGSTAGNVVPPKKNASPVFLAENERVVRAEVEAGLPER